MLYLVLAIISSMLVSTIMRASKPYVRNNISMLACNYLMCTVAAALYTGPRGLFPHADGMGFAVGLGVISGVLYLAGFVLLQWNVGKNGVVLSAMFQKLGVLVPVVMSMIFFGETPGVVQTIGIVLSITAILLINLDKGEHRAANGLLLVLLLLSGGLADGVSKVFEELGTAALKDQFLTYTFAVALLLCIGLCLVKKQRLALVDAGFGLAIGIPNYFSARFLLLSLSDVPAVIAYPTFSVATIVLITVAGAAVFHERLNKRQIAAMLIILVGLVCLNV